MSSRASPVGVSKSMNYLSAKSTLMARFYLVDMYIFSMNETSGHGHPQD